MITRKKYGLTAAQATAAALQYSGTGSPEGAVTAPVGSIYHRTDGGAGTAVYVKQSGSGNTGWAAYAAPDADLSLIFSGAGSPEGAVTAAVGAIYMRTDGGAGTTLYVKQSGAGDTGWVAYASPDADLSLISSGTGSPESVVTAGVGSIYLRTDGGEDTTLYVKESGAGNTGWVAYGAPSA